MQVKLLGELHQGSAGAAGYDLKALHAASIPAGARRLVDTGVRIQMPDDLCALVVPRSGLALKKGLSVLNAPGLVDPDYTGCVGVILQNHGDEHIDIAPGERIAQLLFVPFVRPTFITEDLVATERGEGGFGSTGSGA